MESKTSNKLHGQTKIWIDKVTQYFHPLTLSLTGREQKISNCHKCLSLTQKTVLCMSQFRAGCLHWSEFLPFRIGTPGNDVGIVPALQLGGRQTDGTQLGSTMNGTWLLFSTNLDASVSLNHNSEQGVCSQQLIRDRVTWVLLTLMGNALVYSQLLLNSYWPQWWVQAQSALLSHMVGPLSRFHHSPFRMEHQLRQTDTTNRNSAEKKMPGTAQVTRRDTVSHRHISASLS